MAIAVDFYIFATVYELPLLISKNYRKLFHSKLIVDMSNIERIYAATGVSNSPISNGQDHDQEYNRKRWKVVLGSGIGLLPVFGILSTLGILQEHLSLYELKEISIGRLGWIFSIFTFTYLFTSIIVGPLFDIYGSKRLVLIGGMLMGFGIYMTSIASRLSAYCFYFGIITSSGTSFCMIPLLSVIPLWFDSGLALPLALAQIGGSLGGLIVSVMLRSFLISLGFAATMRILCIYVLACMTSAVILIDDSVYQSSTDFQILEEIKRMKQSLKGFSILKFFDKTYSILLLSLVLNQASMILIITYIVAYGVKLGLDESTSYALIIFFNISGIFGRIFSAIADRYGEFNIMCICSLGMCLANSFILLPSESFDNKQFALTLYITVYGFFCNATYSLTPVLIRKVSDVEDIGKRIGIAFGLIGTYNLVNFPIANEIGLNSYDLLYISIMSLLSTCLFFITKLLAR